MTESKIRLLVHGASGRMGRALLRLAADDSRFIVVAAVSRAAVALDGLSVPIFASSELSGLPQFDVAVDFSLPDGFDRLLAECLRRRAALVSGTTGLDDHQRTRISEAGNSIPIVWASNFSLGVVVMEDLVRRAAQALGNWHIDITETHHEHKQDAPSGTALTLARAAQHGQRAVPDIRSVREGEVIGEHCVRFSGAGECLELTHRANNRDVFSLGALEAAARLPARPAGLWKLSDLMLF